MFTAKRAWWNSIFPRAQMPWRGASFYWNLKYRMHQFKITFRQQLLLLSRLVVFWFFFLLIGNYILKFHFDAAFIYVIIFFLVLDTIPALILHIQYLTKNWNAVLTVDPNQRIVTYETTNKKVTYPFSQITHLDYYRGYGKGTGWHAFSEYRFYKITFADKSQIVVTCLMINRIEKTLERLLGKESKKHASILCLLEWCIFKDTFDTKRRTTIGSYVHRQSVKNYIVNAYFFWMQIGIFSLHLLMVYYRLRLAANWTDEIPNTISAYSFLHPMQYREISRPTRFLERS